MADKKHILFISSWYPTKNDPTLGIFNVYFARAAALFNNVTVLNVIADSELTSPFNIRETDDYGLRTVVVRYKKVTSGLPLLSQVLKWKWTVAAFEIGFESVVSRYGKPDLIHLNVAMPKGVGALHLSRKFNIPFVLNENWSGYTKEDNSYRGLIQKYMTRKIVRAAKFILPTSNYLKNAMLHHRLKGNYRVIPNVVNVQVFRPAEVSKKSGTHLIHISSLNDREKNVSGLIRGFAQAAKTEPELYVQIVGEGVDKEKYRQLVRELNLTEKVKFLGRLFSADLVQAINASDALIMFSNFETFCLVNIEAFACGKPVITSDAGAISEYMNEQRGYLVQRGREDLLADAIITFTKEKFKFDAELIRKYAVDNYSYEVIGKRLDMIYNEALVN